jgi:hypothetical protein
MYQSKKHHIPEDVNLSKVMLQVQYTMGNSNNKHPMNREKNTHMNTEIRS